MIMCFILSFLVGTINCGCLTPAQDCGKQTRARERRRSEWKKTATGGGWVGGTTGKWRQSKNLWWVRSQTRRFSSARFGWQTMNEMKITRGGADLLYPLNAACGIMVNLHKIRGRPSYKVQPCRR